MGFQLNPPEAVARLPTKKVGLPVHEFGLSGKAFINEKKGRSSFAFPANGKRRAECFFRIHIERC